MPEKSDLPQGALDLLILKIAALGPVHGYAIAQRLQLASRDVVQVPQGSLYPALHRLENRGLSGGRLERDGDRPRGQILPPDAQRPRSHLEAETASWAAAGGGRGPDSEVVGVSAE